MEVVLLIPSSQLNFDVAFEPVFDKKNVPEQILKRMFLYSVE